METRRVGASPVVLGLVTVWLLAKLVQLLQESLPGAQLGLLGLPYSRLPEASEASTSARGSSAGARLGLSGLPLSSLPEVPEVSTSILTSTTLTSTLTSTLTLPLKPWFEQLSGSSPLVVEAGWASEPIQAVCLDRTYGGFGNQMEMLRVAVETAKRLGLSFVRLPAKVNPDRRFRTMYDLLDLENVWQLGAKVHSAQGAPSQVSCAATCNQWCNCVAGRKSFSIYRSRTPEMWRRLISEQGRVRCEEVPSFRTPGRDTLTMHLRSGDVLKELKGGGMEYWKMPPCEFWLQAFHKGSYSEALIVTERDRSHPCIDIMEQNLQGRVTVQSSSYMEDFCTMMHSRDIAVGISTLGLVLLELSLVTRTVYAPSWSAASTFATSRQLEKCVVADFADYPEEFKSVEHKTSFVRSYPREKVVFKEKPCGPDHNHFHGTR